MGTKKCKCLIAGGLLIALAACDVTDSPHTVHLKGQIQGMADVVELRYDGAASMLGNNKSILLILDKEGCFDTIVSLNEPSYFRIQRNTLYISPGDDLTMEISSKNTETKFLGRGAEANEYMKYRLFPQAGSFLSGGKNVKEDYATTRQHVDSMVVERRAQLRALKNVSDEFKKMEEARINADLLNTFYYYPIYTRDVARKRNKPEMAIPKEQEDSFYVSLNEDARPLVETLNEEVLMDVAVVRSVLGFLRSDSRLEGWCEGITLVPGIQDLFEGSKYAGKLNSRLSQEVIDEVAAYVKTMNNQEYAQELYIKMDKASKLLKGKPAIDFSFTDMEGNTYRLSDFKGKLLYVDLWATWCGPCIAQSPYFEALSKEYKDKDVVFLAISKDSHKKDLEDYLKSNAKELPQYHSADPSLDVGWEIKGIPRFLLIDKDFNIIDAHASWPSNEKIRELLDEFLN